jgi:hypothetical protein
MNIDGEFSAEEEVAELRRALANAQRAEARAKKKSADLVEAVYQAAKDAALAQPRHATVIPPKAASDKKSSKKAEVALIHLTDWQAGKVSVSYNIDVLRERIALMMDKVTHLTNIQRAHHPVNDCVLVLGGDMVEGLGIFPGQQYEIGAHVYEQLFSVSNLIEAVVLRLASEFNRVHVVCEYGNHGRIGRKGDMPSGDNIDRMAYRVAQDRLTTLKNVTWQQSDDWHQLVAVGNYRLLVIHGDEIPSFGGQTPAYSILRKINAWATFLDFNDCMLGHFHTPMNLTMANGGRIWVTGSPESDNQYAKSFVAAVGRPSQRLHFVDPEKGRVTAEYVCFLD